MARADGTRDIGIMEGKCMTHGMNVGLAHSTREVEAARTYVVTSGTMHLDRLEDGRVRHWPDRHVFMVNEATGDVVATGDRGTYAACWPAANRGGRSLHAFLLQLGFDYFMQKAHQGPYTEADVPLTLRDMRQELLADRRAGEMDGKAARNLWDLLDEDVDENMDERTFVDALYADRDLCERFCVDGTYIRRRPKTQATLFWNEAWKAFRHDVLLPWREREVANKQTAHAA